MKQGNKQLLLKDLCARLPYGVICHYDCTVPSVGKVTNYDRLNGIVPIQETIGFMVGVHNVNALFDNIKPYLRRKDTMTQEEQTVYRKLQYRMNISEPDYTPTYEYFDNIKSIDYLYSIHIDVHDLIPKGLALEAPKGMYN